MSLREFFEKRVSIRDVNPADESMRSSLTPDYWGFRNVVWGQSWPVNYQILWKAFLQCPELFGCITTITDAVVGNGYAFDGPKLHKKKLEDVLKKNNWTQQLRDIIMQLLIYGDAYLYLVKGADTKEVRASVSSGDLNKAVSLLNGGRTKFEWVSKSEDEDVFDYGTNGRGNRFDSEKVYVTAFEEEARKEGGKIKQFYTVDPATIRIDYDEHGVVHKYIQRVRQRRIDYYPDEIIHFKINVVGDRIYGHSPLYSLLYTLQTKENAELYTAEYFRRSGIPRMIYRIGKNSMFSKEQVERTKMELRSLHPYEDIVLSGDIESENVVPKNTDLQFRELLEYLREQIFIAYQVPPVLLGKSDSANRNQSSVNQDMFLRNVNTKRAEIASIMNLQFFTDANFGFDDVIFKFDDSSTRDLLKDAQTAQLLSTLVYQQILTPQEIRVKFLGLPEEPELGSFVQNPMLDLQPGVAGTNLGNKNPNVQNPMENQDRKEEAEGNNTEGQMRSKRQIKKRVKEGGPTEKDRDYPYGAVPPELSTDDPRAFMDRMNEVLNIVRNPIENSDNINHVRDFSKPEKKPSTKGLNSKNTLKETVVDKAVFYKGTDQLSEEGEDAKA